MLPSGPEVSRAEFGSSRECSKKLTQVPAGGAATPSFIPKLQWRREDRTDAVERERAAVYEGPGAGGTIAASKCHRASKSEGEGTW